MLKEVYKMTKIEAKYWLRLLRKHLSNALYVELGDKDEDKKLYRLAKVRIGKARDYIRSVIRMEKQKYCWKRSPLNKYEKCTFTNS